MSASEKRGHFWHKLFPTYGNWGGVCWTGGKWNDDPAQTDWTVDPVDYMDSLFKCHDWMYQTCRARERLDYADRYLVQRLHYARPGSLYGKAYRIGAMVIFTVWPYVRRLFHVEH